VYERIFKKLESAFEKESDDEKSEDEDFDARNQFILQ
jgi:hypothetical protein